MEKLMWLKAEKIIEEVARICHSFCAKEVILYGSRAKGTAQERSDIDIAVSGVENFDLLAEKIEELPTLYSVDLLNMDTCRNQLLLEDIREYGRKIVETDEKRRIDFKPPCGNSGDRRFQYLPYHLRTQQTGIRSATKNSAQFPADQP